MKVTIHQPTFLPYLGFFKKIAQADVFVVYDSAQYSRGDWHNRNRILTEHGVGWLTIPVTAKVNDTFNTAKLANADFKKKHLATIEQVYKHAPFLKTHFPEIKKLYGSSEESLHLFNWQFIEYFFKLLGLEPKIIYSSQIPDLENLKSTDALIKIVQHAGGTQYISGPGGENYLEIDKFASNNIELVISHFEPTPYRQQWSSQFEPNLSALDAIMNVPVEDIKKMIGL